MVDAAKLLRLRADRVVQVLHARQCVAGVSCEHAWCSKFRDLIRHMAACTGGTRCKYPSCVSTNDVMHHFNTCRDRTYCRVCSLTLPRVLLNARGRGVHSVRSIELPALDPGRSPVYLSLIHI